MLIFQHIFFFFQSFFPYPYAQYDVEFKLKNYSSFGKVDLYFNDIVELKIDLQRNLRGSTGRCYFRSDNSKQPIIVFNRENGYTRAVASELTEKPSVREPIYNGFKIWEAQLDGALRKAVQQMGHPISVFVRSIFSSVFSG